MYKKLKIFAGMQAFRSVTYLFHELRKFKWYSVILPFLGCAARISLSYITIYMPKLVLDAVEQQVDVKALLFRTIVAGVLLALASVANLVVHNMVQSCSQTFLYIRLTTLWEQKVMSMDYEAFTTNRGKLLMEKARNVISSPNWGVVEFLPKLTELLENILGLLVFCAVIGYLSPLVVVFLVLLFGAELLFGLKVEKKKQSFKEETAQINRKLNYIAYGTKGMQEGKDIRIYSMAAFLREVARVVVADKRKVEEKVQSWQLRNMLLKGGFILLRDGVAYLYLIYCFLYKELSLGDFTLYFAAITGLGNWLTKLTEGISGFAEALNYVTDFRSFMELAQEAKKRSRSVEELTAPLTFSLENVCFSYFIEEDKKKLEIPVLKNINLTIGAGEKLAIVGVNGAGKSTLVKLLCGLLSPTGGTIRVNGVDCTEFCKQDYYSLFSAVFQNSGVLPVGIGENIMLNTKEEPDSDTMWRCIRMAGLEEKVNSLPKGADTCLVKRISEEGTELSGGQIQRLLLARALYKDAPVLLLDEPTAALDPIAENEIYEKYNQFTEGKTAVFISHRLASTRFCDRIIMLEQGEVIESGTHEELLALGGRYAQMFAVQSQYYRSEGVAVQEQVLQQENIQMWEQVPQNVCMERKGEFA